MTYMSEYPFILKLSCFVHKAAKKKRKEKNNFADSVQPYFEEFCMFGPRISRISEIALEINFHRCL